MHRIVIAPDSFKGSLSALEVAESIASGIAASGCDVVTDIVPLADGGEGTIEAIACAYAGRWHSTELIGVHRHKTTARWYAIEGGPAIIEAASVLGLPLIEAADNPLPVGQRDSSALGWLLMSVLDAGIRDIVIGLGGSSTNDAGFGLLAALGARAFDRVNRPIKPSMQGLLAVDRLDLSGLDSRLQDCRLRVLCDVDNPLTGEYGATRIYGPQKGVTESQIMLFDGAFENFARRTGSSDYADAIGCGAAGGLGFALTLLGGQLESGAQAVLELVEFRKQLTDTDLVITGEGRSDRQTLSGKLPVAVARAAQPVPTALVSGAIEAEASTELRAHFVKQYSAVEMAGSLASALAEPQHWLRMIGTVVNQALNQEYY